MQDSISDMFTRIKNGHHAKKQKINLPSSKFKIAIANILKKEGYIKHFTYTKCIKPNLELLLKYFNNKSVITNIKRISKSSIRIYKNKRSLPKIMNGLGIAIISTSKGLMTDKNARKFGLGGEIICYVY